MRAEWRPAMRSFTAARGETDSTPGSTASISTPGSIRGATINTLSPRDRTNGPVTFNNRSNDYQLNQAYLRLKRDVNTDGDVWDVGGRVDLLYGSDSIFTEARGLETNDDFSPKWNAAIRPGAAAGLCRVLRPLGQRDRHEVRPFLFGVRLRVRRRTGELLLLPFLHVPVRRAEDLHRLHRHHEARRLHHPGRHDPRLGQLGGQQQRPGVHRRDRLGEREQADAGSR